MKELYTTKAEYNESPAGLRLLTEWADYPAQMLKAKSALRRLVPSLEILRGDALPDGTAYTSSSDFAALWLPSTEARKRGTLDYLRGVALTDDVRAVAVYEQRDENGAETGYKYEII